MALIRSKDTKPEIAVRRSLHAMGLRFRLHVPGLPGRPDIVIKKLMVIVHVKGCFWHGHRCLKGRVPVGNRPYWREKIIGNKARDKRNDRRLRVMGWTVKTIWECRVRRATPAELAIALQAMLRRATEGARPHTRHRRGTISTMNQGG